MVYLFGLKAFYVIKPKASRSEKVAGSEEKLEPEERKPLVELKMNIFMGVYKMLNLSRYRSKTPSYDVTVEKKDTDEITVMSFNVRVWAINDVGKKNWYYRAPLVIQSIADVQPDIIGFQEVRPHHESYLKSHLFGYEFYMVYRCNDFRKEGMLIAWRKDRFRAEKQDRFWLSNTPEKMSRLPESGAHRVTAYVTLYDERTKKTFTVLDTHLDHLGEKAREKGMLVNVNEIEKRALAKPVILMGDMNDYDDSVMYKTAQENGLIDARNLAEKAYDGRGVTYHGYGTFPFDKRIDFFFVSAGITVKDYAVFDKTYQGVYPSDHFPIVMKITV